MLALMTYEYVFVTLEALKSLVANATKIAVAFVDPSFSNFSTRTENECYTTHSKARVFTETYIQGVVNSTHHPFWRLRLLCKSKHH